MAPHSEGFQDGGASLQSPFTSGEEWLEKKRELDGAEGLWRIHNKLYDFTLWSRTHPGGKFWIETTRGTDVTEAFESHHLSETPASLLKNFYKRDARTGRENSATFGENGFHGAFKRKLRHQERAPAKKVSLRIDVLVATIFLTALAGTQKGICWTVTSGLLLGVLSASCHDFLHMKDNWRVNYFNLSLMSWKDWKIRHVLSHHQHRNTSLDLETRMWQPLLLPSAENSALHGIQRALLALPLFALSAHLQFSKRILDVLLSRKLGFHREELASFSLPLFLLIFGRLRPLELFLNWSLIIMTGSFVFSVISSISLPSRQRKLEGNTERDARDFGLTQTSLLGHPRDNFSPVSYLNSFRGNVLHYLCPAINCGRLEELVSAFEETCEQFGVRYKTCDSGLPEGHVFFS